MNQSRTHSMRQSLRAARFAVTIAIAAHSLLSLASSPSDTTEFDLATLLADVRENDPSIEAARLRWEALRETAPAAGRLPDPNLTFGYFLSNVETRVGPMESKLNLSQKIPFPGKLKLAEQRALSKAETARWQYLRLMRDRATQAKRLYAELYRIDTTRTLVAEQSVLVVERIETLKRQYESNQAELSDLLLANQRLAEIKNRLFDLDGQRVDAVAQLNRLRGAPASAMPPSVDGLPEVRLLDPERLIALAEENSEWLQAENAAIATAEAGLAIAERERLPDFTVGVEYTEVGRNQFSSPPDNGQDAAMGYISVNLPIWRGKYEALAKGAQATLEASEAQRSATLQDLKSNIVRQHARATAFTAQVELYREQLLPHAEARHEATLASYAAGQTTALHWIESQRDLLQAQSGLVLLEAEYFTAIAELERIAAAEFGGL